MARLRVPVLVRTVDLLPIDLRKIFIHKDSVNESYVTSIYQVFHICGYICSFNECEVCSLYVQVNRQKTLLKFSTEGRIRASNAGLYIHIN